jgi:predicted ATP-grasp superfamily ATP-dependent carboligase
MKDIIPNTPIVIMGPDGANPLGIARAVGRAGVPVFLLSNDHSTLSRLSRFVTGGQYNVDFAEPVKLKRALELSLQNIQRPDAKPLLAVTNEIHYSYLLPIYDFVTRHFNEITPACQAAPLCEKEQQFPLAQQAGFRISNTIVLRTAKDLEQVATLQFPVLVKPRTLRSSGGYKNKADIFDDIDSLRANIKPTFIDPATVLLAQEFVPGDDKYVMYSMASCGENGDVRAWFTGRKLRQHPPGRGVMSAGYLEYLPDLAEKTKVLCKLFGLRGFVGVECKQHPDTGELFYIESSLRVEANNSICMSAKRNLVLDAYLAAHELPCSIPQDVKMTGSWCDISTDLDAARLLIADKKLTWKEYFTPLPRPVAFPFFAWDDLLPFLRWLPLRLVPVFKKVFRRQ